MNERAQKILRKIFFYVTLFFIVGVAFLRASYLNGNLIYEHSWGEAQYAQWARYTLENGFFWGIPEIQKQIPGFVNYVPLISYLAAKLHSFIPSSDLVSIGRSIAFLVSFGSLYLFFQLLRTLGISTLLSVFGVSLLQSSPVFFRYSNAFYNEPLSFFFLTLCLLLLAKTYFPRKIETHLLSRRWIFFSLFISTLSLGILKPPTLLGPVCIVAIFSLVSSGKGSWRFAAISVVTPTLLIALFIAQQRAHYGIASSMAEDRWIFSATDVFGRLRDFYQRVLKAELGIFRFMLLGTPLVILYHFVKKSEFLLPLAFIAIAALVPLGVGLLFLPGSQIHGYYILPCSLGVTAMVVILLQRAAGSTPEKTFALIALLMICGFAIQLRSKIGAKLAPNFYLDMPIAMKTAKTVLDNTSPDVRCIVAIGPAIPNHAFYLGRHRNTCTFIQGSELEAKKTVRPFVAVLAKVPEHPYFSSQLDNCFKLETEHYEIFKCHK